MRVQKIKANNIAALNDLGIEGKGLRFLSNTELRLLYESVDRAKLKVQREIYGSQNI